MGTGKLHEHHIVYKSRGGALTDPRNLVAACTAHHERLIHGGVMRCRGEAPDDLRWEMGIERGREPFLIYTGENRVAGEAM
jgi:hypothetical protein